MASGTPHSAVTHTDNPLHIALHRQLLQRRKVLAEAAGQMPEFKIAQLLQEVDAALERFDRGHYGVCERCHGTMEDERLLADPLTRICLCELNKQQVTSLEKDLELAAQIQSRLLPCREMNYDGWAVAHHYRPLSLVSGDYCDLVMAGEQLYFMVGDVAGKGVAASLLMSNLSAIFRALIPIGLPLAELMKRANHVFSCSTLPNQFATLICGRTLPGGGVEISGAGHVPALLVNGGEVTEIASQGLPMGLYAEQEFASAAFEVAPGGSLVLFSDGVSEAHVADEDYGYGRIAAAVVSSAGKGPAEVVSNCVRDLETFLGGEAVFDDQTLMVLQRSA